MFARNAIVARRRRQHHLHRHRRPHRRVPGDRGPRARPRRRAADLCAQELGDRARHAACDPGARCTSTPSSRATSCTTCTSRARAAPRRPPRLTACASHVVGTGSSVDPIGLALRARATTCAASTTIDEPPRAARSSARSTEAAPSLADAVAGADARGRRGAGRRDRRAVIAALDAGAAVVTDVGSVKAGRRRGRARNVPTRRRGSSAATRWPAPSRTVSTAPTPTCSSARPGCSRRPRTPTSARTRSVLRVAPRARRRGRRGRARADHDALVAVVSHVPQLAASTLMDVATTNEEDRARCCGSPPAASAT